MQSSLLASATQRMLENTHDIESIDDFKSLYSSDSNGGFSLVHCADEAAAAEVCEPMSVTPRCIPLDLEVISGKCIFSGKTTTRRVLFARSY